MKFRVTAPPGSQAGPPATPDNILYYASVKDFADYTITSKMYYKLDEMDFGMGFVPEIEHFPRDNLPVQPSPVCE